MATTAHSLAVLTNACVKPPVDPQTGLSTSLHDRISNTLLHLDASSQVNQTFPGHFNGDSGPSHVLDGPAIDALTHELSSLPDDEFYEKLQELKDANRRTLEIYEKLYKKKIKRSKYNGTDNGFDDIFNTKTSIEIRNTATGNVDSMPVSRSVEVEDSTSAFLQKPPTGRLPTSTFSKTTNGHSPKYAQTRSVTERPNSAPPRRAGSLSKSLEEEVFRKIASERLHMTHSQRDDFGDNGSNKSFESEEMAAAMEQIEDMWENFSVDNYAPKIERPSSASITRREKSAKEKEWRHRITIPKPFNMTIRDENKGTSKLEKVKKEVEQQRLHKEKEEELECQKKFKAAPVPAHVYLPLFDEIMEQKEARRQYVKENSIELLKSQEKPFNFVKREHDRKLHKRSNSVPCLHEMQEPKVFKAKPVPSHVYDTSINDKIAEEEEYRKIRVKMHAKNLLKEASLPPSMEARKRFEEQKKKEKQIKSSTKKKHSIRSKVNHEVPDYEDLYRHFQKELARRKREREATVVKPFNLYTSNIKSHKDRVEKEMYEDTKTPSFTPRTSTLSMPADTIPAKTTTSSDLRSSHTKKKIHEMTRAEREQLEADRKRRIQEMRLRRQINERLNSDQEKPLEKTYRDKIKDLKRKERATEEYYKQRVEDIKEKVNNRPLLFEQQSKSSAKASAEKKFTATLKNYGLDDEFIQTRSSRAGSVQVGSDAEEDYKTIQKTQNDTFTRENISAKEDEYNDDFEASAEKSDYSEELEG